MSKEAMRAAREAIVRVVEKVEPESSDQLALLTALSQLDAALAPTPPESGEACGECLGGFRRTGNPEETPEPCPKCSEPAEACGECGGERDVWQHDETGRICATAARPGPRWFSAPCPSCSEPAAPAPSVPGEWVERAMQAVHAGYMAGVNPDDTWERVEAEARRLLAAERGKGE